MSRIVKRGTDPVTGRNVKVGYGWDSMPGCNPGYFFQVFNPDDEDELFVNEGFMDGISEERLQDLINAWDVK